MDEKTLLPVEEQNETVSAAETSETKSQTQVEPVAEAATTSANAAEEAPKVAEKPVEVTEEPEVNSDDEPAKSEVSPMETENAPTETATIPEVTVSEPSEGNDAGAEETSIPQPATKAEVIARLQEIAANEEQVERATLDALKQTFYRLHNAEATAAREAFIAKGGNPDEFVPEPDADEDAFKEALNQVREQRAKEAEKQQGELQSHLEEKERIIARIKEMNVSADVADKSYKEFKELQARWKEIGDVPAERQADVWKAYQQQVETFYDLLRLNYEFRNYDFKKNLEIKTALCEAAERLAEVEDPVSAFHSLQQLHRQYREAGPVAKELREEVWTRFKAASTVVNKRHQAHFEQLKAQEEENLAKKTALCEQVEAIDVASLKSAAAWDKATKQVTELQAQWKTIGFTPRKVNAKIFERFRAACDVFFKAKSDFFKTQRAEWAENLAKKNAICEEAEALQDSTDWGKTTNKLIELQRQWKEIGPVARRVSDQIWKRFNGACNAFFEKKNEATGSQRKEEQENLEKKNDIITQLENLLAEGAENAREKVQELMAEWNATGHVPFRKKEAIYKRYHDAIDRLRTEFHISAGRRSVDNFRSRIAEKVGTPLERELARLKQQLETKRDEIKNYETNLSFFTSKSKSGNALVDGLQKNIERLKSDLVVVEEKIKAVKEQILNGNKPVEATEVAAEETPEEVPTSEVTTAPVAEPEVEASEPEAEVPEKASEPEAPKDVEQ